MMHEMLKQLVRYITLSWLLKSKLVRWSERIIKFSERFYGTKILTQYIIPCKCKCLIINSYEWCNTLMIIGPASYWI